MNRSEPRKQDGKIFRVNDPRIVSYTRRGRHGSTQVFYTGNDSRDFARFRADGGNGANATMHDKPDTIKISPPEKHYYADLVDGVWWWKNGCAECNGRSRNWLTYIECDKHDVCRDCSTSRDKVKTAYGGELGWQCDVCHLAEYNAGRIKALQSVADRDYCEWDYKGKDDVVCPHCATSYEPDIADGPPEGEEECETCGGTYFIEPEYSVTYSTTVVGERVTL